MLNEEIHVNIYQKKIGRMSKLVETIFISAKSAKIVGETEVFSIAMLIVSLCSMNSR